MGRSAKHTVRSAYGIDGTSRGVFKLWTFAPNDEKGGGHTVGHVQVMDLCAEASREGEGHCAEVRIFPQALCILLHGRFPLRGKSTVCNYEPYVINAVFN